MKYFDCNLNLNTQWKQVNAAAALCRGCISFVAVNSEWHLQLQHATKCGISCNTRQNAQFAGAKQGRGAGGGEQQRDASCPAWLLLQLLMLLLLLLLPLLLFMQTHGACLPQL